MRIQAAVLRDPQGPFTIEDLDLADPGPHQILVKVAAVGHCHTDVLPRAQIGFGAPPIVLGHEGAGVVEAVGSAVETVAVGDHVVLSFDSCGTCANCRGAHPAYCDTFFPRNLGGPALDGSVSHVDGAGTPVAGRWFGQSSFATHALVDAKNAVVVDPSLPLAMLAPLACGVQTGAGAILEALDVRPGDGVVITGTGAVGLSAVMAANAVGAGPIIAVDINADRLALASEFGATHAIDGAAGDLTEQIAALAPRYGLDTTGLPAVITAVVDALPARGVLGLVGVQQSDLVLAPTALAAGKTLTGILEGSVDPQVFIPRLIGLWQAGKLPFDRLVTTLPLSEINTAEQRALAGEIIKPVLIPGE
ncbi:NAD(P)-dependent alcohol dehydrogenase [Mycolicibacillus trivialis]|uniref:Alcohol dehydrogenase n=1 Tax=Mycolicibacillus trivialis TaxID=1798 RepID=A0A1X2EJZ4_9MYCO|nr:NAD(P)-dependent alcohol dehydrogenase [Mycolicibacillus trivialis]ORX04649.1 alcohol dehydrogenase [Mycolicibacillus trivialis]